MRSERSDLVDELEAHLRYLGWRVEKGCGRMPRKGFELTDEVDAEQQFPFLLLHHPSDFSTYIYYRTFNLFARPHCILSFMYSVSIAWRRLSFGSMVRLSPFRRSACTRPSQPNTYPDHPVKRIFSTPQWEPIEDSRHPTRDDNSSHDRPTGHWSALIMPRPTHAIALTTDTDRSLEVLVTYSFLPSHLR